MNGSHQQRPEPAYIEQPFIGHLVDSILLCELAEQLPQAALSRHGTLARSSIMAAAFCIEAAANALLVPLEAPPFLRRVADELPILEKFEFVLFAVKPGLLLERGGTHAQAIQELFEIRNRFVHSRPRARAVARRDLGDGAIQLSKTGKPSNQLKLAESPEDWSAKDSVRVVGAVSDFLDYFTLDLCEMKREQLTGIFLSQLLMDGGQGALLLGRQKDVLARAERQWPIAFRLARVLRNADGDPEGTPGTVKLEASYSWESGGLQSHQNKHELSLEPGIVTNHHVADAMSRFLAWFYEAHTVPHGRSLRNLKILSAEHGRVAEFSVYLPLSQAELTPVAENRRMGVFKGVAVHSFVNAIVEVSESSADVQIMFEVEDGSGRVVTCPAAEAHALVSMIEMNRHSSWSAGESILAKPETVETKGRDYMVQEFEVFAYDPSSRTALLTYRAVSGKVVQMNMSTATAMRLQLELVKCLRRLIDVGGPDSFGPAPPG